ncbi:MAG: hypothetical protein ACD_2C00127G0001 [uncultured bacterium (gcode 4)]|uniref:Uncharacterized protein n=1 Tax=uncultured bacterium (gcode 4) TaxID=1234023 RepID=K2G601_9BACT|nr:MAG: hypothetical protein ACD_2C00127G0001 [uncultured bacterium (gcode 4)]
MAPTDMDWMKKRQKSLKRILANLDTEERELEKRGILFKEEFKEVRQSIRKITGAIEKRQ